MDSGYCTASLETYSQSDPVAALLAAFAISIKLDPKEFYGVCETYCRTNFSLDACPGMIGGFGRTDIEYEAAFPVAPMAVAVPVAGFSYGLAQRNWVSLSLSSSQPPDGYVLVLLALGATLPVKGLRNFW